MRLVAVSETKPIEMLESAYTAGCRIFGENYMQELVEKVEKLDKPDIQWHFIGGLKSNKCKALVDAVAPNVDKLTVETVASKNLANKLNSAVSKIETEECLSTSTLRAKKEKRCRTGRRMCGPVQRHHP